MQLKLNIENVWVQVYAWGASVYMATYRPSVNAKRSRMGGKVPPAAQTFLNYRHRLISNIWIVYLNNITSILRTLMR